MATRIGLAAILTALLVFFAPAAQAKVTNGKCADNTGLNVVVDFQGLGGGHKTRCVEDWSGGSALSGFQQAGFSLSPVDRWGYAFVCRVDGKPGQDREKCIDTPPADAFWAFFTATNGSWGFVQNVSVTSQTPAKGSWIGLSFSQNKSAGSNPPPRVNPAVPSAPKPKPKPKPTETSKPNPKPSSSKSSKPKPSNSKTSKPSSSATSKPGSGSSSTSSSSPSPSDSETSTPSASDSPDSEETKTEKPGDEETAENSDAEEDAQEGTAIPPGDDDTPTQDSWREGDSTAQNVRAEEQNSGPPVGTLITIGAIVLLAGAAFVRHRFAKKPESS